MTEASVVPSALKSEDGQKFVSNKVNYNFLMPINKIKNVKLIPLT